VQLPLTLIIACVLYFWGEKSAEGVHRFGRRLAGERGERAISLAGRAIRAVALGVVLTALAQSLLGGIALWIAGVPFAGILTSVMFLLALAQIGAVPVLLCAAAWLYWRGQRRLDDRADRLVGDRRQPRQHHASAADQARRGSVAALDLRRRDRRPARVRDWSESSSARSCSRSPTRCSKRGCAKSPANQVTGRESSASIVRRIA
jgi:hypothetical protein